MGISNCTLANNGEDSIIEYHEYPGLWRYGTFKFFPKDKFIKFKNDNNIEFTIKRWAVQYPFNDDDSFFTSSSDMLNKVWTLMKDSLRLTSLDTFTDSNTRERLPYEADGYITARSRWVLQEEYEWPKHSIKHVLLYVKIHEMKINLELFPSFKAANDPAARGRPPTESNGNG